MAAQPGTAFYPGPGPYAPRGNQAKQEQVSTCLIPGVVQLDRVQDRGRETLLLQCFDLEDAMG